MGFPIESHETSDADRRKVWKLEDGRPAISYDEQGPYAILPAGLEVMKIQDILPVSIYLLRYP